jgi:hypothetical protein
MAKYFACIIFIEQLFSQTPYEFRIYILHREICMSIASVIMRKQFNIFSFTVRLQKLFGQ